MTADQEREDIPGIIEAAGLTKIFGSTSAVDGIAFSVRKGEVFGFLGPNGAGKTTTMKMIACVSPRTSGTLTVLGMDPDTAPGCHQGKARGCPAGDKSRSRFHLLWKPVHLCPVFRYS